MLRAILLFICQTWDIIDETLTGIRYSMGHREAVQWGIDILASKVIEKMVVDEEIFDLAWDSRFFREKI